MADFRSTGHPLPGRHVREDADVPAAPHMTRAPDAAAVPPREPSSERSRGATGARRQYRRPRRFALPRSSRNRRAPGATSGRSDPEPIEKLFAAPTSGTHLQSGPPSRDLDDPRGQRLEASTSSADSPNRAKGLVQTPASDAEENARLTLPSRMDTSTRRRHAVGRCCQAKAEAPAARAACVARISTTGRAGLRSHPRRRSPSRS